MAIHQNCHLICVLGGKGGVGKSVFVCIVCGIGALGGHFRSFYATISTTATNGHKILR